MNQGIKFLAVAAAVVVIPMSIFLILSAQLPPEEILPVADNTASQPSRTLTEAEQDELLRQLSGLPSVVPPPSQVFSSQDAYRLERLMSAENSRPLTASEKTRLINSMSAQY